ncbi:hypothetical protein LJK88_37465 [Paenibacillus sp. P26]|nr:hypothetical protein LJK88_37465 [Paenibacillus sp. P26]UUZ93375.1 hypothetical protein LJK87_00845 [Paenibacillus sp. P25]
MKYNVWEIILSAIKISSKIFPEIGSKKDNVHFLLESKPNNIPTMIVETINHTAEEIFSGHLKVNAQTVSLPRKARYNRYIDGL